MVCVGLIILTEWGGFLPRVDITCNFFFYAVFGRIIGFELYVGVMRELIRIQCTLAIRISLYKNILSRNPQ